MNKKLLIFISIAVIIGAIGWTLLPKTAAEEETIEVIKEVSVKKGDMIIDFLTDGNVDIPDIKQRFLSNGILAEVFVTIGDRVEEGDLLAKLDTRGLELKLAQAELSLLSEEEKLTQSESDSLLDVKKQEANVSTAAYDLSDSEKTLNDMKTYSELYSRNDIEAQERKVSELKNDYYVENMLLTNIKESYTHLSNLPYEQAKLDIEIIKLDIENAYIYAGTSGSIAYISDEIGSSVTTSSDFVIIQKVLDPKIISNISELDIYQVTLDQKVLVNFESDYGLKYEGIIEFINPIAKIDNNGIVTYEVFIDLIDYPEDIKSGLTTMLNIVIKEKADVLIIPNTAVKIVDNKQVIEIKRNEELVSINVITGLTDGLNVEVIQGLEIGDIVITRTQK